MGDLEVGLQADGALVLAGRGGEGELVRLTFAPRGAASLTIVRGDDWTVACVEAGTASRNDGRLVRVRAARPGEDGDVESCCTLACTTGERFERELRVAADGSRRWTGAWRLRDGTSWTEEGSFDGSAARIGRRALDACGEGLWSERRETTFEGPRGARSEGSSTVAERTFDAGGGRSVRRVAFGGEGPLRGEGSGSRVDADGKQAWTSESRTWANADGGTTTRTVAEQGADGTLVETVTRRGDGAAVERTLTRVSADGEATLLRGEAREWPLAADEGEGVEVQITEGGYYDEFGGWHEITTSRAVGPDGSTSETVSHIAPDGSVSIEVSTMDAGGNGTITTTVTDASGTTTTSTITVTSTITIFGPGGGESGPGSGTPGGGSPGGGESGPSGPPGPGEGGPGGIEEGLGKECPDDGEWSDCPPKMKEYKGRDPTTRMLPEEVGAIVDALGESRLEAAVGSSLAARVGEELRRNVVGARGVAGAAGGAAGAARGAGAAGGARRGGAAHGTLTHADLGPLPDRDELRDPACVVALLQRAVAAVARAGGQPPAAVHRALAGCAELAREVEREQARERAWERSREGAA